MANNNQNLFDQTYTQLLTAIGSQAGRFQMIGNPINFSWPIAPTGQESLNALQLMNMVPKWSPVGSLLPGDSDFFSSYRRIFSLVTVKISPEKQNDLQNKKDELTKAQNDLNNVWTAANSAYQAALKPGGPVFAAKFPDVNAWLAGPGSTYQHQADGLTTTINKLTDEYTTFLAEFSTDPTLTNDMNLVKKPTGDISGPAPDGWTKVANNDGSLSWAPVFNVGTTGQDWRAKLSAGSQGKFTLHLAATKQSSEMSHSWAGASFSYSSFFWGISGSGGWDRLSAMESDSSVTVDISVQSSAWVPVTAGEWYDSGLMKQLARNGSGPGVEIVQPWVAKGGPGSQSIFGQYGILSTRVAGLVVVYKPSYSINMQSNTYEKFQQKIQGGGGLRIGPFTFGGSGGSEHTSYKASGNKTTLTGESTSEDPLIIGVSVAFPGLDEA